MRIYKRYVRDSLSFWMVFLAFSIAVFALLILNYIRKEEIYYDRINQRSNEEMCIDIWWDDSDEDRSEEMVDRLFVLLDEQSFEKIQLSFVL